MKHRVAVPIQDAICAHLKELSDNAANVECDSGICVSVRFSPQRRTRVATVCLVFPKVSGTGDDCARRKSVCAICATSDVDAPSAGRAAAGKRWAVGAVVSGVKDLVAALRQCAASDIDVAAVVNADCRLCAACERVGRGEVHLRPVCARRLDVNPRLRVAKIMIRPGNCLNLVVCTGAVEPHVVHGSTRRRRVHCRHAANVY